jgi:thiamine transport system substrate-binding protein
MNTIQDRTRIAAALVVLSLTLAACGGGAADAPLRLLTHDSFDVSTSVLEQFTAETGIVVEIVPLGDAGSALNRVILTADDPEGDVLFGIDSTFLTRALAPTSSSPPCGRPRPCRSGPRALRRPRHPGRLRRRVRELRHRLVRGRGPRRPARPRRARRPAYAGLLAVQNPATSSPGLAFLLGTSSGSARTAAFAFWERLRANDVLVTDGWSEAYYGAFTHASDGDRPLVVSYASSPPAEVLFATEPTDTAPTGVILDTCYRQIEYAGILAGTTPQCRRRTPARRLPALPRVPGGRAAHDVRVPRTHRRRAARRVRSRTRCSPSGRSSWTRSASTRDARAGSTLHGHGAAVNPSGRTGVEAAGRPRRRSARLPRAVLRLAAHARARARVRRRRLRCSTRCATCSPTRTCCGVARFTLWQAVASTALTLMVGLPVAAVLSRSSSAADGARGGDARAVRAPDRRRRDRLRRAPRPPRPRRRPAPHDRRDPARPRVLQRVGRRAHRRWAVAPPRRAPVLAARTLGAIRLRAFREVTLPRLRPAIGAARPSCSCSPSRRSGSC